MPKAADPTDRAEAPSLRRHPRGSAPLPPHAGPKVKWGEPGPPFPSAFPSTARRSAEGPGYLGQPTLRQTPRHRGLLPVHSQLWRGAAGSTPESHTHRWFWRALSQPAVPPNDSGGLNEPTGFQLPMIGARTKRPDEAERGRCSRPTPGLPQVREGQLREGSAARQSDPRPGALPVL